MKARIENLNAGIENMAVLVSWDWAATCCHTMLSIWLPLGSVCLSIYWRMDHGCFGDYHCPSLQDADLTGALWLATNCGNFRGKPGDVCWWKSWAQSFNSSREVIVNPQALQGQGWSRLHTFVFSLILNCTPGRSLRAFKKMTFRNSLLLPFHWHKEWPLQLSKLSSFEIPLQLISN